MEKQKLNEKLVYGKQYKNETVMSIMIFIMIVTYISVY